VEGVDWGGGGDGRGIDLAEAEEGRVGRRRTGGVKRRPVENGKGLRRTVGQPERGDGTARADLGGGEGRERRGLARDILWEREVRSGACTLFSLRPVTSIGGCLSRRKLRFLSSPAD
jgi:hypothetical protein